MAFRLEKALERQCELANTIWLLKSIHFWILKISFLSTIAVSGVRSEILFSYLLTLLPSHSPTSRFPTSRELYVFSKMSFSLDYFSLHFLSTSFRFLCLFEKSLPSDFDASGTSNLISPLFGHPNSREALGFPFTKSFEKVLNSCFPRLSDRESSGWQPALPYNCKLKFKVRVEF